jgi:hypothetical protein
LTLNATQIDNQAAVSRREETQGQNLWSASQGQTVDLSGWSKPVIKVLDDVKNGQFSQARDDAGKLVNAARDEVNKLRQGDYQGAWNQIKQLGIPQLGSEISLQDSRQNSSQLAQGASGSQCRCTAPACSMTRRHCIRRGPVSCASAPTASIFPRSIWKTASNPRACKVG